MKFSNIVLFDDPVIRGNLLPLTLARPVSHIRIGIMTIHEKWEFETNAAVSTLTIDYLQKQFPPNFQKKNLFINGSILPNAYLIKALKDLDENECLVKNETLLAANSTQAAFDPQVIIKKMKRVEYSEELLQVNYLWEIFSLNDKAITEDFIVLSAGKKSQQPQVSNHIIGSPANIFIEEGAKVTGAFLNADHGPIYIGKNAEVMEGSLIRGPFALCENSTLKMGAKIYGATTIGPHCKVGGEINNSVIFGYSNKAHDGFLGNSVIAEWCNIGADSNNSNLKNNYGHVRLWHYPSQSFIDTGLQFVGLFMADHSKCSINSMFNTGTVVGFSANIFGTGFPRNYVPSFSWGGSHGFSIYQLEKAMETAERMMQRRGKQLTDAEKEIWKTIYEMTVAKEEIS